MSASTRAGRQLRVDRVACSGHGICASLLPASIGLDEWGYPVLEGGGTPGTGAARAARGDVEDEADLERAVRLCPARALYLTGRA